MKNSEFEDRLAHGQIGEGLIAKWLNKRGWAVLPAYEKEIHTGKGPALFTSSGQFIAPDILTFNQAGQFRWVEAKTKSAFTWHRISQQWVTGIDLRHYQHYIEVSKLSPFPLCLFFLHLNGIAKDTPSGMQSPTGLFVQSLNYLTQHENHRHENWGKWGMVYWAITSLRLLAELKDILPS